MKMSKKGLIFCGCSYVWGYGLNYYYDNSEDNGTRYGTISGQYPEPHLLFQYAQRFSNKIANYYNTFHIQPDRVSGSDTVNVDWLQKFLDTDWSECSVDYGKFSTSDFHTLIFQTSYMDRTIELVWEKLHNRDNEYFNSYEELAEELGDSRWQENYYLSQTKKIVTKSVIDICKKFESLGIKVYFVHATDVYKHIDYMKERTIWVKHKEKEYFSINEISDDDESSVIALDFDSFEGTPPDDLHPSLNVHNSIYKSIINKLNNND